MNGPTVTALAKSDRETRHTRPNTQVAALSLMESSRKTPARAPPTAAAVANILGSCSAQRAKRGAGDPSWLEKKKRRHDGVDNAAAATSNA